MPYKINGVTLYLQPTTGRWAERGELGVDGGGHSIYPAPREFELRWGLMDSSGLGQLENYYNQMGNTGTLVFDLPRFGISSYTFYSFSGCTMTEPQVNEYFEQHYMDVRVTVRKAIS